MSLAQLSGQRTRRFTTAEVLRMVEAGVLAEDEPLELLEGELVEVTPQGPSHRNLVAVLGTRLARLYPDCTVSQNGPIDAGERSLPEPDVAVVRGGEQEFAAHHPKGQDTLLVIEVARTSQVLDRAKAAIYARAGVPVYWLVDVPAKRVEVYEGPLADGSYRMVRVLGHGDALTPPGTDAHWPLSELLP